MNDEERLINANIDDITFEGNDMGGLIGINIFVDGQEININGLLFDCEPKPNIETSPFQLHISIPSTLRRKGIAEKLYTVFLKKCGNVISFFTNRVSAYAHSMKKELPMDNAVNKILSSILHKYSNAHMDYILNDDGDVIGVMLSMD